MHQSGSCRTEYEWNIFWLGVSKLNVSWCISLSKFDRRCVLMLETWLRRFEVDRKCRLASRPVFLLDQIFLLFSWREQQQNTTFTKLSLFTPHKFYWIIKFISWVQFDISLRVILHQLWKILHYLQDPGSKILSSEWFLYLHIFLKKHLTPNFCYLDPLWNSFLFLSVKKKF